MLILIAVHKVIILEPSFFPKKRRIFLRFLVAASILGNGTLLLLLMHRRSRVLENYRHLLASFALTDIAISMYHAWYIPVLLSSYACALSGYGPLTARGFVARWSIIIYTVSFNFPFYILCMHIVYLSFCTNPAPNRLFAILDEYGITLGNEKLSYVVVYYQVTQNMNCTIRIANAQDANMATNYTTFAIVFVACCLCGGMILISAICIWKITVNGGYSSTTHSFATIPCPSCTFFNSGPFIADTVLIYCVGSDYWERAWPTNDASMVKMSMPIFISTLENIESQSLRELTFLICANSCLKLSQTGSYMLLTRFRLSCSRTNSVRFRATLNEWLDVIFGRTAESNEQNAKERTRMHNSILRNAPRSSIL
ncbi:hypothetical protein PRIPAC_82286 [Pristionchus pacificus]|uniref:Uncharacterized protein n=1 Tax=Pristionchus pacificus TaxID=54126 RepID=A0A2A6C2F7_PRIPA|nr:hypothetical protein PRIPAC_82286 [Pristionchus pacificus]|eukprot:PDM72213.1 hypothetical protein PRIPAC_38647 [Pristionchus pacificus]